VTTRSTEDTFTAAVIDSCQFKLVSESCEEQREQHRNSGRPNDKT